jgi:hypothetical protein
MKKLKIEFEDQMQDFLYFTIFLTSNNFGEVISAEPFQNDVWKGYYVLNAPKVGGYLSVSKNPESKVITIKYPIVAIEELPLEGLPL